MSGWFSAVKVDIKRAWQDVPPRRVDGAACRTKRSRPSNFGNAIAIDREIGVASFTIADDGAVDDRGVVHGGRRPLTRQRSGDE
jgi:hypothetical protein